MVFPELPDTYACSVAGVTKAAGGEHEANTASLYRGLSVGDISMGEVKTQDITPDLI